MADTSKEEGSDRKPRAKWEEVPQDGGDLPGYRMVLGCIRGVVYACADGSWRSFIVGPERRVASMPLASADEAKRWAEQTTMRLLWADLIALNPSGEDVVSLIKSTPAQVPMAEGKS